jgi:hypothetical protein
MTAFVDYVSAGLLGAAFGLSELVSRYRDGPGKAIRSTPSVTYVLINAIVAAGSLFVVKTFGWSFGTQGTSDEAKVRTVQVLVTGFAAMGLLRSSFFTVRVGNQDVGIGLSAAVQAFLKAADAAVDRHRSMQRDLAVNKMSEVRFDVAVAVLPAYCLGLMQNLPKDEQASLLRDVENIRRLKVIEPLKSKLLCLAIMNVVGEQVLAAATASLADQMRIESEPA